MAPGTMAQSGCIGGVYRRLSALCLLVLFLVLHAMPLLAGAVSDDMRGMSCCKHGRESCCRRKPLSSQAPSMQAGHPCGSSCAGMPGVPTQMTGPFLVSRMLDLPVPFLSFALEIAAPRSGSTSQISAILWQRPPPTTVQ